VLFETKVNISEQFLKTNLLEEDCNPTVLKISNRLKAAFEVSWGNLDLMTSKSFFIQDIVCEGILTGQWM